MGTTRSVIVAGALSMLVIGCGSQPVPPQESQQAVVAESPATAPVVERVEQIETVGHFEASAFCEEFRCVRESSYGLQDGNTNVIYEVSSQDTTMEVQTDGELIVGLGVSFYERPFLSKYDLEMIDALLTSLDGQNASPDLVQFVGVNSEKSVSQIRQASSMRFGVFEIWAGKIGNQVVSIERHRAQ